MPLAIRWVIDETYEGGRWLAWSVARKSWALALVAMLAAIGVAGVSRIGFEASYAALLSEDAPSVRELAAVKLELGGGTSELVLVVTGPAAARDALVHAIAARLDSHPDIARADADLPRQFFADRALYLVDRVDLDDLAAQIDAAFTRSVAARLPIAGRADAGEGDSWAAVIEWRDQIEARYAGGRLDRVLSVGQAPDATRPSGARSSDTRRYLFVRPRVSSTELGRARAIMADIRAIVGELRAAAADRGDSAVTVQYGGRLAVHLAEQASTQHDLRRATLIALALVVFVLIVVLRRVAAPLLLAIPLVLSLAVTLAVAAVLVGDLNVISAFTLPALVGLGIDFGIHLYTRYLHEMRIDDRYAAGAREISDDVGDWRDRAMRRAIGATIGASATSAMTTSAAFGSLALVDFRGFREFGLLGGCGVMITLVITYIALPPLAVLATRRSARSGPTFEPLTPTVAERRVARVTRSVWPARLIVLAAVAVTVWLGARVSEVRFVNDFGELKGTSRAIELTEQIEADLGLMLAPTVFVVPDLAAARALGSAALAAKSARDPLAPVGVAEVFSAARLIPADGVERAAVLDHMRERLDAALAYGELAPNSDRRRALERLIALTAARPYDIDDLPASIRRRLVGQQSGRYLAMVWPDDRLYVDTVMRAWLLVVDQLRSELAETIGPKRAAAIQVLDERRIPLEVVDVIRRDLPRALALAGALVLLVLFVQFRRVVPVLVVAGSMLIAMTWLFGALVVAGLQLNVYNAVVVPCIIGIGIDNAIHIHHAYDRAGRGSLGSVLATTGLAVTLASITTAIGFGAAMIARQGGLVSMGITAVIGVACALAATTLVLPAALRLREPAARSVDVRQDRSGLFRTP